MDHTQFTKLLKKSNRVEIKQVSDSNDVLLAVFTDNVIVEVATNVKSLYTIVLYIINKFPLISIYTIEQKYINKRKQNVPVLFIPCNKKLYNSLDLQYND